MQSFKSAVGNASGYIEDQLRCLHTSDLAGASKIHIVHITSTSSPFDVIEMSRRAVITTGRWKGAWVQWMRDLGDQDISECISDCRREELEGMRCTYSHFVDMISSCSSAVIAIRIMSENLHEITTTASSTLAAFLSEGDGHKEETREDGETVVPEGVIEKEIEHMLKKVQKDEKVWSPSPTKRCYEGGCGEAKKEFIVQEAACTPGFTTDPFGSKVKPQGGPTKARQRLREGIASCAGIAIVNCSSLNMVISVCTGFGVLLLQNSTGWSPPLPIHLKKNGVGLTFGGGKIRRIVLLSAKAVATLRDVGEVSSHPDLTNAKDGVSAVDELSVFSLSEGTFTGIEISSCTLSARKGMIEWVYGVREKRELDWLEVASRGESEYLIAEAEPLFSALKHCETLVNLQSIHMPSCLLQDELHGGGKGWSDEDIKKVQIFTRDFVKLLVGGIEVEIPGRGKGLLKFSRGEVTLDGVGGGQIEYINHQFSHTMELPETISPSDCYRLLEVVFSSSAMGPATAIVFLAPTIQATILMKLGLKAMEESVQSTSAEFGLEMPKKAGWTGHEETAPALQRKIGKLTADFNFMALRVLLLDVRSPVLELWRDAQNHHERGVGRWRHDLLTPNEQVEDDITQATSIAEDPMNDGFQINPNDMMGYSRDYHCCIEQEGDGGGEVQWVFTSQEVRVLKDDGEKGGNIVLAYIFDLGDFKCWVEVELSGDQEITVETTAKIFQLESTEILDQKALWQVKGKLRSNFGVGKTGILGIIVSTLLEEKRVILEDGDDEENSVGERGFNDGIFADRDYAACANDELEPTEEPPSTQRPPKNPPRSPCPSPPNPPQPDRNSPTPAKEIVQITTFENGSFDELMENAMGGGTNAKGTDLDSTDDDSDTSSSEESGEQRDHDEEEDEEGDEEWEEERDDDDDDDDDGKEEEGEGEGEEGKESKKQYQHLLRTSREAENPLENASRSASSEEHREVHPAAFPIDSKVIVEPLPKLPLMLLPVYDEKEEDDDKSAVTQLEREAKHKEAKRMMSRLGLKMNSFVET